MARKALIVKTKKRLKDRDHRHALGKKQKHPTRVYHRCNICGRGRAYLGMFGICRICFRKKASKGEIVGVKKASW